MYGTRQAILVLAAVFSALATWGRASSAAGAPGLQSERGVEIVMTEYAFGPAELLVGSGAVRLRIVNGGIRRHNVVVQVDGVEYASPAARPGEVVEWDVEIERSGRYLFWCGEYRHLEKGMTGTLVVE